MIRALGLGFRAHMNVRVAVLSPIRYVGDNLKDKQKGC